jgi:hypothetical protein
MNPGGAQPRSQISGLVQLLNFSSMRLLGLDPRPCRPKLTTSIFRSVRCNDSDVALGSGSDC